MKEILVQKMHSNFHSLALSIHTTSAPAYLNPSHHFEKLWIKTIFLMAALQEESLVELLERTHRISVSQTKLINQVKA